MHSKKTKFLSVSDWLEYWVKVQSKSPGRLLVNHNEELLQEGNLVSVIYKPLESKVDSSHSFDKALSGKLRDLQFHIFNERLSKEIASELTTALTIVKQLTSYTFEEGIALMTQVYVSAIDYSNTQKRLLSCLLGRFDELFDLIKGSMGNDRKWKETWDKVRDVYETPLFKLSNLLEYWHRIGGRFSKGFLAGPMGIPGRVMYCFVPPLWAPDDLLEKEGFLKVKTEDGENAFRKVPMGNSWKTSFGGKTAYVKDSLGMKYIAHLLDNQNKNISALELVRMKHKPDPESLRLNNLIKQGVMAGPEESYSKNVKISDYSCNDKPIRQDEVNAVVDRDTLKNLEENLQSLRDDLQEAKDMGDLAEQQRIQNELKKIEDYISGSKGVGEKIRLFADEAERNRMSVTNAIDRAYKDIVAAKHLPLYEHLKKYLRTGTSCSYHPETYMIWDT